jgi:putative thioredoxin
MVNNQIVHVDDTNFQYEVLAYSQNTPVVVEFWAAWCRDCRSFYPRVEALLMDQYPHIRLAVINVDENPNTTLRYAVRSLPVVKAFSYARIVDQITGIVPEKRLTEMFSKLTDLGQNTLLFEKAANLFQDRKFEAAEEEYRNFLQQNTVVPEAQLGLAKTLLAQNKYAEAQNALQGFPPSKQSDTASLLVEFVELMLQHTQGAIPHQTPLEATFNTCLRLVRLDNYEAALDGLLDILKKDKEFRQGEAKIAFLAILEFATETDVNIRKYRNELNSVLF